MKWAFNHFDGLFRMHFESTIQLGSILEPLNLGPPNPNPNFSTTSGSYFYLCAGLFGAATKKTQEATRFPLSPLYISLILWRPKVGKKPENPRFSWLLFLGLGCELRVRSVPNNFRNFTVRALACT